MSSYAVKMISLIPVALLALIVLAEPAHAAPGLGDEVYGAEIEAGELELESRYGALAGGPADGEDALKLEAAYSVSNSLRLAALGEFNRNPGGPRKASAAGVEAIYRLGKVGDFGIAVYGEYEIGIDRPDSTETKLIIQRHKGPLDLRLNLIAEKQLAGHSPVEFSYAGSIDYRVAGEFSLGARAFGDLGTVNHVGPSADHYVGPVAKIEIDELGPEIELETGYLFAIGATRQEAKGQVRVMLGIEF